jgi:alanine dehydrogenase
VIVGLPKEIKDNEYRAGLKEGVNTYAGHCTYEAVATAQGMPYTPLENLIAN